MTKIIFVHIPKTAGTTLDFIIRQNFRESESFRIYGDDLKSTYPEIILSNRVNDTNIRIFMGHIFFGLHKYLTFPATYFAFVRDPIKRAISHL